MVLKNNGYRSIFFPLISSGIFGGSLARAGDDMAKEHYRSLEKTASDCISCGQCNSRFPFSVNQMSRMQEIKEFFEHGAL